MCRFLLLSAPTPHDMRALVAQFAHMCTHSKGLTGTGWQGDGWGVAWRDAQETWHVQRSLAPIWTEAHTDAVQQLPPTRQMLVHARSASFPQHTGDLAYCQPYVAGPYAFVFNGFLKGVRLPQHVPGAIGAEKLWYLVQERLRQGTPLRQALAMVYALVARRSRHVQACNMGLSDGTTYAWYNGNPQAEAYYGLYQATAGAIRMVCSEPFGAWGWQAADDTP